MEHKNQPYSPMPEIPSASLIDRLSSSIVLKLFVMLVLVLFLLIPLSWVQDLIAERSGREVEVGNEISSKWGGSQLVSGPVIGIPYRYAQQVNRTGANGKLETENYWETDYVFLTADQVKVEATVDPELRKRGIYQTVVYNGALQMRGSFGEIDLKKLNIAAEDVRWQDAKLFLGLSDVKGLKSAPKLQWNGQASSFQIGSGEVALFEQNMSVPVDLSSESTKGSFSLHIDIRGSKALTIFPTAEETAIAAKGTWPNPSFDGGFLPDEREVGEQAFSANWQVPSFSRKFPRQWTGAKRALYERLPNGEDFPLPKVVADGQTVGSSDMATLSGLQDMVQINFLESVNNYQKTSRVAKYAVLVILLTFTSLFFTEILKKQRVHLIQYILIGCAMVLFYSLLLAIAEHLGFNWSYLISALATIALISSFIFGITKDSKLGIYFSGILSLCYAFIFFLLQLQDYALIVGTVGVFIMLALLMRFSLKINWYQFEHRSA